MVVLKQILKRYNCPNLSLTGRELTRLLQFIIANGESPKVQCDQI